MRWRSIVLPVTALLLALSGGVEAAAGAPPGPVGPYADPSFGAQCQWHRFGEKKLADDELRAAAAKPATPVDQLLTPGLTVDDTIRFRTVTAAGRYDATHQVLVRRRQVNDTPGFLVITPLRTGSGKTLFIDRGFVPATGAATETPKAPDPPAGEVQVTARVLPSETGGLGLNLPERQIERIDVGALAAKAGVPAYPAFGELISSTPAKIRSCPAASLFTR